jgi:hypothetical protein
MASCGLEVPRSFPQPVAAVAVAEALPFGDLIVLHN